MARRSGSTLSILEVEIERIVVTGQSCKKFPKQTNKCVFPGIIFLNQSNYYLLQIFQS
jgi:hypothetical protein